MQCYCSVWKIVCVDGMTVKMQMYVNVEVNVLLCLGVMHKI